MRELNREAYIVDTTLRDGEQTPGKTFSIKEKVAIAKYLDNNRIYQIEAGIPAMGNIEKDCINKILDIRENSFISTWNRLCKKDIEHSFDCKPDIIHLSVPTSNIQIFTNLKKDTKWIEKQLKECVHFTKSKGYEVTIGFEDASRADIQFLVHLCKILKSLEVSRIRYADTVGILTPSTAKEVIKTIVSESEIEVEIHAHNDFGMATAISIEAVKSGAKYVDCTIDGIGERAGNCNLQEFLKVTKDFLNNSLELSKIKL